MGFQVLALPKALFGKRWRKASSLKTNDTGYVPELKRTNNDHGPLEVDSEHFQNALKFFIRMVSHHHPPPLLRRLNLGLRT